MIQIRRSKGALHNGAQGSRGLHDSLIAPCNGCSVGKAPASLRSVSTTAPRDAASFIRACHAFSSRDTRPMRMNGRFAACCLRAPCGHEPLQLNFHCRSILRNEHVKGERHEPGHVPARTGRMVQVLSWSASPVSDSMLFVTTRNGLRSLQLTIAALPTPARAQQT